MNTKEELDLAKFVNHCKETEAELESIKQQIKALNSHRKSLSSTLSSGKTKLRQCVMSVLNEYFEGIDEYDVTVKKVKLVNIAVIQIFYREDKNVNKRQDLQSGFIWLNGVAVLDWLSDKNSYTVKMRLDHDWDYDLVPQTIGEDALRRL